MNENQTTWESREQQVSFAKNIASLIQKKFGSALSASYQGAGEVADLLLTGRGISASKIEEVRNFLTKSYKLDLHKIKNHGHIRGTILIHISEVSEASRTIVEEEILNKIILPERLRKKKKNLKNASAVETIPSPKLKTKRMDIPVVANEKNVEKQNKKTEKMEKFSIIKKGRFFFTSFLAAMFKFEGIILSGKDNIFSFDDNKTEDYQTVNFRNEVEASMANQALTWMYGDSKVLPAMEKNYIMLDFLYFNFSKRYSHNIVFTHSPVQGESVERIQKRAIRLMNGYKPSHVYIINQESFSMGFPTLSSTQKFFNFAKGMGWDAFMENDLIICKFRPKPEIAAVEIPETSTIPELGEVVVEESASEVKEATPISEPEKKVLDLGSNFVSPRSVSEVAKESGKISAKNLFTQREAIEQFEKMFYDEDTWSKISEVRKPKIIAILKDDLRKKDKEEFVLILLSHSPKSLFTKEEATIELQSIFKNPNFLNLPESIAEKVRLELKEELINLDPDDLAEDLLDLF